MALIELKVPDIGGHANVDVIDVLVQPGDAVAVDASLITLETDKATMDVPATTAGVVREVRVKVGSKVSEGDVMVVVESADTATTAAAPVAEPAAAASPAPAAVAA
ncbi:biotin/lipoyl-containing protein, partial [Laribacter hongkongensis]